ncbi:DUF4136 domain-containing protein [Marinobacter caseinilyticus]|uniref:DUF4136 domain-containing protein n=1 Tax=Marinobacter caseinilyticus TaxID=2692195 RepID=UPI001409E346|nr:DUF4136 domain-containing protein [Marinobacter caseinilyticus]
MRFILSFLLVLALSGCAGNVVTDYNSTVVFGNYNSWAFADTNNGSGFVTLDGARVEGAVERALNRKAMKKVNVNEADLLVSYRVVNVDRLDTTGFSYGLGFGQPRFGFGVATLPPVREVQEGKLVVELVDRSNGQVVWRAASRRYLTESQSPEYRRELIEEVVAEMFTKYPPGV